MASVFFYFEGVIIIDFLEKIKTVEGQYHASEFRELKEVIKLKCREKLKAGVFLFQDNVPIHTAQVAVTEAVNCGYELQLYPLYWLELASSDFFLFSKLKSHLCGHHFRNNDEVICAVEEFLEEQDAIFFCDRIAMIEHHWTKCIDDKEWGGLYWEILKNFFLQFFLGETFFLDEKLDV